MDEPEPDAADRRQEPGESEDAGDEHPRKAVVHRERDLVRDDREHGQRRAEVREEQRPEGARAERVADLAARGAPARSSRPGR